VLCSDYACRHLECYEVALQNMAKPPCGFRERVVAPGLASRRSPLFQVRAMPLNVVLCRRASQPRLHATMAYCFVARWQQGAKGVMPVKVLANFHENVP